MDRGVGDLLCDLVEQAKRDDATGQSANEREGGDVDAAVDNCAGAIGRVLSVLCRAWASGAAGTAGDATRLFVRSIDALVMRGGVPLLDDLGESPCIAGGLADAVALQAPADAQAHVAQRHGAIMKAWASCLLADAGAGNPSVASELAAMEALHAKAAQLASQHATPWLLEADGAPRAAGIRLERQAKLRAAVARGVAAMGAGAGSAAAVLDDAGRAAVQRACSG